VELIERRRHRRVADAVGLHISTASNDEEPAPSLEQLSSRSQFVRLSEAGVRLFDASELHEREQVWLTMLLKPDNRKVHLHGTVVDTGEETLQAGVKQTYASIEFGDIAPETRELLATHVSNILRQTGTH